MANNNNTTNKNIENETGMSMGALFNQRRAAAASRTKEQQTTTTATRSSSTGRTEGVSGAQGADGPVNTLTKRPSLLEIQAEQEREAKAAQAVAQPRVRGGEAHGSSGGTGGGRRSGGGGSRYDDYNRSGGGGGGGREWGGSYSGGGRDMYSGGNSRGKQPGSYTSSGSSRKQGPDLSTLPKETGAVATLLDKFGFIHCTERPTELFFHQSELVGMDYADLNVDDEVEFFVGPASSKAGSRGGSDDDGEEKLAAYSVRVLDPGTVVWETEDEPGKRFRGRVEQTVRAERDRGGDRGGGGGSTQAGEGTIRLIFDEGNENTETKEGEAEDQSKQGRKEKTGDLVYFTSSDYTPPRGISRTESTVSASSRASASSNNSSSRLGRNDIVEFVIVTSRRDGRKYARDITLIEAERERLRLAREKELLANATLEQGIVVTLKRDYGFLRSNKRREEIYFHFSNLVQPNGSEEEAEAECGLKEGQEMEFLVVKDDASSGGRGGRQQMTKKFSAREIKLLPPGSVEFEKMIAEGVTGTVTLCPRPLADSPVAGGTGKAANNDTAVGVGKVRLHSPIPFGEVNANVSQSSEELTESEHLIKEVLLHPSDSPGGSFPTNRDGSQTGVWIREGDVILFDVVRDSVDNSCRAAPTKHLYPLVSSGREETGNDKGSSIVVENSNKEVGGGIEKYSKEGASLKKTRKSKREPQPLVRLISPCLAGRAEGIVSSIRDNYGFIHCAERAVDAYFRLYEVFPKEIQADLRRNVTVTAVRDDEDSESSMPKIAIGDEVSFDLSVQGVVTPGISPGGARGRHRNSNANQERENLKAQRILILPPNSILQTKVLAQGIRGVISKEDPKQPYAGYIDLEDTVKGMTFEERHPLVAKLIDSLLIEQVENGDENSKIVFHDVQSPKEDAIIMAAVEERANGRLVCSHIPVAGGMGGHPGKLCISRVSKRGDTVASNALAGRNADEGTKALVEGQEDLSESGEMIAADVSNGGGSKKAEDASAAVEAATSPTTKQAKKKKKSASGIYKVKSAKVIRYDKHCLVNELQSGMPPGKGDVVMCHIIQSRRTGVISVSNVKIVERKLLERGLSVPGTSLEHSAGMDVPAVESESDPSSGVGLVVEVVSARQFGFISLLDENATKREMLFFHLSSVIDGDAKTSSKNTRGGNGRHHSMGDGIIRKGDEVKFDIVLGKNGKRVAVNISILPHGTLNLPTKADRNACQGYILLEPSHTSLANTPLHTPSHSFHGNPPKGGGRWDNVDLGDKLLNANLTGSNVKEEGCILLLSDPVNLFSQRKIVNESKKSDDATQVADTKTNDEEKVNGERNKADEDALDNAAEDDTAAVKAAAFEAVASAKDPHPVLTSAVGTHLSYKIGAVALRGAGSSSSAIDGSDTPRRGDLVSFMKTKNGRGVRDIRVIRKGAATLIRGSLENINHSDSCESVGTARFVAARDKSEVYDVSLDEVVSCDVGILKERVSVEGILYEGKVYGICRTADLYLESKLGAAGGRKERPRLNLTVKKELKDMGGKIIAQSGMAKGPDGTHGFHKGWTKRKSLYDVAKSEGESNEESVEVPSEKCVAKPEDGEKELNTSGDHTEKTS